MSTDSQQPASDDTIAPNDTPSADEDKLITEPTAFITMITVGYVQRFLDTSRALNDKCRLHLLERVSGAWSAHRT